MMKTRLVMSMSALATLASLLVNPVVIAKNNDNNHPGPKAPKLEVSINTNGKVAVHAAKVTAVTGNTITATTTWGSLVLTWTVNTDGDTSFVRRDEGHSAIGDVAVGSLISFNGTLVTTSSALTVNASHVKSWSVPMSSEKLSGTIQSLNAANNTFVLATADRGNVTVQVHTGTNIEINNRAAAFADLRTSTQARVSGPFNSASNILTAGEVRISVDKPSPRTFEGRVVSVVTTGTPSLVVRVGNTEYTVRIVADTAILSRLWLRTALTNFKANDHVRIYGTASGNIIDATVIRNTSITF